MKKQLNVINMMTSSHGNFTYLYTECPVGCQVWCYGNQVYTDSSKFLVGLYIAS